MPTYEYACTECTHRLEVVQSFTDASLTECPECSGRLRKVFSPVGVVFKGSGFYKTDSRAKSGSSGSAPAAAEKKADAPSSGATVDSSATSSSSSAGKPADSGGGSASTPAPSAAAG